MKPLYLLTLAALSVMPLTLRAQQITDITSDNVRMERQGKFMSVDMDVNVSQLDVSSRRAVVVTPWIVGATDSLQLTSIGIYGRQRYYYYLRNEGVALTGDDEQAYRASEVPDHVAYHALADYADWMNGAQLKLVCSEYGCCNRVLGTGTADGIAYYKDKVFAPQYHFLQPEAELEKQYEESGTALIIFPVNQTVLVTTLANNDAELTRIKNDVTRLREDSDIYNTRISLEGFASPEGTYANNTRLAEGRVQAVRNYLKNYYHLADNAVTATSVPENWDGLRQYVETSSLDHRSEILAIIDRTDLEPDAREWKLKQSYPSEYATLLRDCYPYLRRTNYRIDYSVRQYTDINEIKQIYQTTPKKLSLNELYLLAQTYEAGSDDFNDVFETAVRLYPTDATANLNAGLSALQRGDTNRSANYLAQAGDSPAAIYARGLQAALTADYATALPLLRQAAEGGITEAQDAIDQLQECNLLP